MANRLAHKTDMQISHRFVYSNLNKSGPWIHQNGKIMFHMTFPYGEACDSEQYSIRPQVSPERDGITHKNWDIKR